MRPPSIHWRAPAAIALLSVALAVSACLSTSSALAEPVSLPPDVVDAAAQADKDPIDVLGALNTLSDAGIVVTAHDYLFPPARIETSSVSTVLTARVKCIESKESGGENVWRGHTPPRPGTDKPGGVMQYFASTFLRGASEMGHPDWSRWNPAQAEAVAAHDLATGWRSQWTVSGC